MWNEVNQNTPEKRNSEPHNKQTVLKKLPKGKVKMLKLQQNWYDSSTKNPYEEPSLIQWPESVESPTTDGKKSL